MYQFIQATTCGMRFGSLVMPMAAMLEKYGMICCGVKRIAPSTLAGRGLQQVSRRSREVRSDTASTAAGAAGEPTLMWINWLANWPTEFHIVATTLCDPAANDSEELREVVRTLIAGWSST